MAEEKKYKLEQVSVRLKLCEETPLYSTEQIDTPRRAIDVMKDMLRQLDREYVCIVNLDNGGHPINFNVVSIGNINSSIVSVREILKSSILSNAAATLMLHNHPSYRTEKPVPSTEDNISTLNVMMASEIMGIPLRDHVIVAGGTGSIYSYRAELKDNFSIEGLQELLGIKDRRALVNEKAADYKPLAKIEELEEENYNQIDNYLSNTISPAEEKRQRILRSEVRRAEERPSVRARLREGKAKMEAEKQQKAMMTRQRITEKTK